MKKFRNSITFKIAFAYVALALINIIFFSVMILENQTDLILDSFKHQADSLAKSTSTQIQNLHVDIEHLSDEYFLSLQEILKIYNLNWYKLYDSDAKLLKSFSPISNETKNEKQESDRQKEENKEEINIENQKKLKEKIQQLQSSNALFQTRYLIELHKENFSVDLFIPIKTNKEALKNKHNYLLASLNLKSMQERLQLLYMQVLGAVIWGIIFHTLFGFFLIQIIFKRINHLVSTSDKISKGDLSSRVQWKMDLENQDELDVLGVAFNAMATNVQDKILTISKQVTVIEGLNKQIQQELKIGKDVQTLLITTDEQLIKEYSPQIYSRPLREVSGDMIHYFKLKSGERGIFFADASGHGVPAAIVTAITYLTFEDIISKDIQKEEIMNQLNAALNQRLQQNFYLTAVLILFDKTGAWITNSGHNTFFIVPKDKKCIHIDSTGLPLGILADSTYEMQHFPLSSKDKIFIYSDGFVETLDNEGNEFGMERLQAHLESNTSLNSKDLALSINEDYNNFAKIFKDDVSYLILEAP